MKIYKIILLIAISSLITSCNSPLVNNVLSAPAKIIRTVTGPLF